MTRLTTIQKTQLNNMNRAAQNSTLGTRLDALEYGGLSFTPSVGTVSPVSIISYTTTPAIGTATYVHAAITLTDAIQTVTTGITNPDFPRIATVKGNDANVSGNVVLTGTDIAGTSITDTIALNGVSEVLGVKAFKTITSIQVPVYDTAGTETVSVGVGNKIGFPISIPQTTLVLVKNFDGSTDAGTITASTTVAGSIYALAGTLNGSKVLQLIFMAQ